MRKGLYVLADDATMHTQVVSEERRDALLIAALGLAFFGVNVDFLMRGDATTYATYVLLGKFDDLTLHIGYYAVVYALQHTVGRWFDVPIHETMVYLNVVCGALTLSVSYLLARRLIGGRRDAFLVALMLALCGRLFSNATSSEIYMLQTLCVTSAMLWYVCDRPWLSGIAAGLGLLVSPLSCFAYLFFPTYELTRKEASRWGTFAAMVIAGSLVYLPYLVFFGHELFYGRRGLLKVSGFSPIDVGAFAANFFKYQFKHYTALLLLLIPGCFMIRGHRRLALLSAMTVLPHIYIVLKLTMEDNTFLLSTDFFVVLWMVLGMRWLLEQSKWRPVALVIPLVHVAILVFSRTIFHGESHRSYATELRTIAKTYIIGKPAVLISDWDVGMSLTHFARDSATAIVEDELLYRQMFDMTSHTLSDQPSLEGVSIYVIDPWEPSPLSRLFSPAARLESESYGNSVRRISERRFGVRCTELSRQTHVLYQCERTRAAAGSPTQPGV